MKKTTISIEVYEVGDIIRLSNKNFNLVAKRRAVDDSPRAMIIGITERLDKMFTYKVLLESGKTMTITPNEQGGETYVGHVDLTMLYGDGKSA